MSVKFWGGPWDGRVFVDAIYDRMPRCTFVPGYVKAGFYWVNLRDLRYDWHTEQFPDDDGTIDPSVSLWEWSV